MKKKQISLLLVGLLVCLTGCTKTMELTDEENHMIAEYAAELLLKHDVHYEDKYFEFLDIKDDKTDKDAEDNTTESTTEESTTEEITQGGTQETDTTQEAESNYVDSNVNIGELLGETAVSIQYDNYMIVDKYPATDHDGAFIYLEASEGMQLLVLQFQVSNVTGEAVDLDLLEKDVEYRLVVNESKSAKSMLTILMDDLSTLQSSIGPGETETAVLVFQISKDYVNQIQDIEMKITYNGAENKMKIL